MSAYRNGYCVHDVLLSDPCHGCEELIASYERWRRSRPVPLDPGPLPNVVAMPWVTERR